MLRRSLLLMCMLLLIAACSSTTESGDIAFESIFDMPTRTSIWTATGDAIDDGLLCASATSPGESFEDENGVVRTIEDIMGLYEVGEPFVNVSVELMTCDDDSGQFHLRLIQEIDPSITDDVPVTASSWTITGDTGYENTTGEGDSELPREEGATAITEGNGTVTTE